MKVLGLMNNGIMRPMTWNWQTRHCAWIFGMGPELLLSARVPTISDGESYLVYKVYPPGCAVSEGEALRAQKYGDACTEFHSTMEMTEFDIQATCAVNPRRGCPQYAFWTEPSGQGWRVVYVASKGVSIVDLMCLRDRLKRPSRSKLFVGIKSFKMAALRAQVEGH